MKPEHIYIYIYIKIINWLNNEVTQPLKFRTKNQVEINDDVHVTYNIISQIKFKTTTLNSSLWDYSDACLLFKGTTTVAGQGVDSADNNDKQVMFKNCTVQRLYKQNKQHPSR